MQRDPTTPFPFLPCSDWLLRLTPTRYNATTRLPAAHTRCHTTTHYTTPLPTTCRFILEQHTYYTTLPPPPPPAPTAPVPTPHPFLMLPTRTPRRALTTLLRRFVRYCFVRRTPRLPPSHTLYAITRCSSRTAPCSLRSVVRGSLPSGSLPAVLPAFLLLCTPLPFPSSAAATHLLHACTLAVFCTCSDLRFRLALCHKRRHGRRADGRGTHALNAWAP